MKILFLSLSRIDDLNKRGIYSDLLRCFHRKGHDIYAAFPYERKYKLHTSLKNEERFHALGIKTLNITKTNFVEKGIGTILLEFQFSKQINRYWGSENFDLILFATPPTSFNSVVKQVKKRSGAMVYLLQKDFFLQGSVDLGVIKKDSLIYKYFRRQEDQLYKIVDYVGCMSQANVNFVLQHNPSLNPTKVEVCPNSIELVKFPDYEERDMVLQKYGIPINIPIFMYGGNLGMPQGIDFLIKVLESNRNRKDVFFVVIGSGTHLNKLLKWQEINKPINVLIRSALPKKDYDALAKCSDVGLIFLDYRFTEPNFPSRLLSYLENRKPILLATDPCTDVGSVVTSNGIGFHSLSNDINAFNENLNRLLSEKDRWEEMGENGYKLLCRDYLVEHSYQIIMNHFK